MGPEKFISQMVPITCSLLQKENLKGFLDGGKREGNNNTELTLSNITYSNSKKQGPLNQN